eukprot:2507294-Rhodomonas_salina.1
MVPFFATVFYFATDPCAGYIAIGWAMNIPVSIILHGGRWAGELADAADSAITRFELTTQCFGIACIALSFYSSVGWVFTLSFCLCALGIVLGLLWNTR